MDTLSTSSDSVRAPKTSKNRGLAAEAYATVRERIIRGELAIGQVISRRKLAAELGMSFLPVTEALIRLENEGLLESRPRSGTRVKVPTRQDVEGHYVVREALEVQAAMLFAERAERDERSELLKLAKRVDVLAGQPSGDRLVSRPCTRNCTSLLRSSRAARLFPTQSPSCTLPRRRGSAQRGRYRPTRPPSIRI